MFQVNFILEKNNKLFENISERGRRRTLNHAFRESLVFWRKEILPKHFQSGNINRYPGQFFKKKKGGIPLVKTGRFRDHILRQEKIKATYKGANIGFNFGRPSEINKMNLDRTTELRKDIKTMNLKIKKRVFSYMKGKKITFDKAKEELVTNKYQLNTYNKRIRLRMKKGVKAFNTEDRIKIRDFIKKFIITNIKTLGKANI